MIFSIFAGRNQTPTDGTAAVWLMDGDNVVAGGNVGFDPGASWHVVPQHHDALV